MHKMVSNYTQVGVVADVYVDHTTSRWVDTHIRLSHVIYSIWRVAANERIVIFTRHDNITAERSLLPLSAPHRATLLNVLRLN